MPRNALLAVLAFAILLSAIPASAATPVQPGCPDASLAAILNPSVETGADVLPSPMDQAKAKACIFVCEEWYQTGMHRGTGASCSAAQSSLQSAIGTDATSTGPGLCSAGGAAFGYCGYIVHVTVACHWDFVLGVYVVDGYGGIKCKDYC